MRPLGRCLSLLLVGGSVMLLGFHSAAGQGILGTKHNLSPTGTGTLHALTQTDTLGAANTEVCVYCHTPHGADTTVGAPLWNRAVNTTGYTMYNSPTMDATMDAQPTGVSQACLSCHDGTIAFDALRNLPGPGGFSNAPAKAGVTTWTFAGTTDKKMPAGGITNIGTDLTNDHPVSMDYSTAKSPSSTDGTSGSVGFKTPTGDVFSNGVRLYSGKVQCGSCHDPHRSNTNVFLRVSNDGSALCLTCHKKDG
ncbi:MAG: cytochrome c3 family protein [Candidatus Rokubacteria bacterium]|nr:cytochrome c3 family protein [Candidatus Rokubacteria bacterium]